VLAACLLAIANESALSVFDPLWPVDYRAPLGSARTVGFFLVMMVAGATVRPRSVGALVVVSAAAWLLLHVLQWVGVFDVFALFAPDPPVWFEF